MVLYFLYRNKSKIMKTKRLLLGFLLLVSIGMVESCGPVVISSRPNSPLPVWFYPNRVELVRYVYFPDHMIYYDLSLRHYIYWNNSVWVTVNVLPDRFRNIDLRRSRYVRVRGYRGDNISRYHRENNTTPHRSRTRSATRSQRRGNDG